MTIEGSIDRNVAKKQLVYTDMPQEVLPLMVGTAAVAGAPTTT